MGFWANWVRQREEIRQLTWELSLKTLRVDELLDLLNREETRNGLLEAALAKESSAHNLTLRRVADNASKQLGLPQGYVKDGQTASVTPPPPDAGTSDDPYVLWQAQAQRDADIEAGINPAPLEHYVSVIKEAPNKYVLG